MSVLCGKGPTTTLDRVQHWTQNDSMVVQVNALRYSSTYVLLIILEKLRSIRGVYRPSNQRLLYA